jgi:hypothetical protein
MACQLKPPTAQQVARTGQAGPVVEGRIGDVLVSADLARGTQQASVPSV